MSLVILGYSGHAYVVIESALSNNQQVIGYVDNEEKSNNPYRLNYLGKDSDEQVLINYKAHALIFGIGNNSIRERLFQSLKHSFSFQTIIDKSANISSTATTGLGSFFSKNVAVNALASIGNGVIINTGAIIEHECIIGDFSHIAPGAVLCGNVHIGENSFIGANSVVKQGIYIGKNVTVGAGSVVIKDIPDNVTVYGNPSQKK
jgi:sugar O-acyltransferase (sialic acid O-acetyltransferase NeuD family)